MDGVWDLRLRGHDWGTWLLTYLHFGVDRLTSMTVGCGRNFLLQMDRVPYQRLKEVDDTTACGMNRCYSRFDNTQIDI